MGVRAHYDGLEHLEPLGQGSPAVLVANHMSMADVFLLIATLPPQVHFVAKKSLFSLPWFGQLLHVAGFIPIDRSNRQRAIASLEQAARRIRDGYPVLVFAEGTRSRDGRLQPFKKGAFHLALRAEVPVMPIAVSGTWSIVRPTGWFRVRPGKAHVSYGRPIPVTPYLPDDTAGLIAAVRRSIATRLTPEELRAEDWVEEAQAR